MNTWTSHCKRYAFKNNINYMDALQSIECQESYTKKEKKYIEKKEKKYIKIKDLREGQNELVMDYLNKKRHISAEEFQMQYLELEKKIRIKSEKSKKYRDYYKQNK